MILSGHDRNWTTANQYEENKTYSCVEYAAIGSAWLRAAGLYPILIVSMQNHDQSWGHTTCEVPNLGTYEFGGNIFFPDYYWHKRPINDNDIAKSTKAVAWTDVQNFSVIDDEYRYDKNDICCINIWTYTLVQAIENINFANKSSGTNTYDYDGPIYTKNNWKIEQT